MKLYRKKYQIAGQKQPYDVSFPNEGYSNTSLKKRKTPITQNISDVISIPLFPGTQGSINPSIYSATNSTQIVPPILNSKAANTKARDLTVVANKYYDDNKNKLNFYELLKNTDLLNNSELLSEKAKEIMLSGKNMDKMFNKDWSYKDDTSNYNNNTKRILLDIGNNNYILSYGNDKTFKYFTDNFNSNSTYNNVIPVFNIKNKKEAIEHLNNNNMPYVIGNFNDIDIVNKEISRKEAFTIFGIPIPKKPLFEPEYDYDEYYRKLQAAHDSTYTYEYTQKLLNLLKNKQYDKTKEAINRENNINVRLQDPITPVSIKSVKTNDGTIINVPIYKKPVIDPYTIKQPDNINQEMTYYDFQDDGEIVNNPLIDLNGLYNINRYINKKFSDAYRYIRPTEEQIDYEVPNPDINTTVPYYPGDYKKGELIKENNTNTNTSTFVKPPEHIQTQKPLSIDTPLITKPTQQTTSFHAVKRDDSKPMTEKEEQEINEQLLKIMQENKKNNNPKKYQTAGQKQGTNNSNIDTGNLSERDKVRNYQIKLNNLGANLKVDGIWGKNTQAAYERYIKNTQRDPKRINMSSNVIDSVKHKNVIEFMRQHSSVIPKLGNDNTQERISVLPIDNNENIKQENKQNSNTLNIKQEFKNKMELARSETEKALKQYYNTNDVKVDITEIERSPLKQQIALKRGYSKTAIGLHNLGLAADFKITINGKLQKGITQKELEPYKILGGIVKEIDPDLFWGWSWDSGHVGYKRHVYQAIDKHKDLADEQLLLDFYESHKNEAEAKYKNILTSLDKVYGKNYNRIYKGNEEPEEKLLDPIFVNKRKSQYSGKKLYYDTQ